ncbi:hypothetical protein ANO14919_099570 [Xylariales sp. No.14919]|nr:hypothetical protein ANO14919_099570 [Xylariales sp. No.14919]
MRQMYSGRVEVRWLRAKPTTPALEKGWGQSYGRQSKFWGTGTVYRELRNPL